MIQSGLYGNMQSCTGTEYNVTQAYGGTYMGFYMDNRMPAFSKKKWKEVLNNFYEKYTGLAKWHKKLIADAYKHGHYKSPTGRILKFKKVRNKYSGVDEYPRGQVLNYPVQSLAADIIHIAMIEAYRWVRKKTTKTQFIMQVHDSMVWDSPSDEVDITCKINQYVFNNLTKYLKQYYDIDFNVPLTGDIQYGNNWGSLKEWKNNT